MSLWIISLFFVLAQLQGFNGVLFTKQHSPTIKSHASLLEAHPASVCHKSKHWFHNPKFQLHAGAKLTVDRTLLTEEDSSITVFWEGITHGSRYDVIALFNATETAMPSFVIPPIKYKFICPDKKCDPPSKGKLSFTILNRRTKYVFVYLNPDGLFQQILAISPTVTFKNLNFPQRIHVAVVPPSSPMYSSEPSIIVMWVQKEVSNPMVKYGLSPKKLEFTARAKFTTHLQKKDLCGLEYGWFDLGAMITAYISPLKPDTTYYYSVGESNSGFSKVLSFKSGPFAGKMTGRGDVKMIIYGDLGDVAVDGSLHHSWDNHNEGEEGSILTTSTIAKEYINGKSEITDVVSHIGDISYAVGFESEWDTFMHQIEPIASRVPYMTGIGNHEYSYSNSWKPPKSKVKDNAYSSTDSNGECGVPYNSFFPFANLNVNESRHHNFHPDVTLPYYFFDYGRTRTIVMSTEHDFTVGSKQYNWLETTLSNTNRSDFPWVLVAGHRPMYSNDDWIGDTSTAEFLRDNIEHLFIKYKVSIGYWGHQHSYGRTCPVMGEKCGEGPTHLIVGMAGYQLSKNLGEIASYLEVATNEVFGFVHLRFVNDKICLGKMVNALNNTVIDNFVVKNYFHSEKME